jgi:photosystem II stability/assembly factor-like uncharacterized protein
MTRFIISVVAVLINQMASAQGWEQQVSPTSNNLTSLVFVDTSNGWAVGDSGTIIHTTTGGIIWEVQSSGTMFNLTSVDFVDDNNGWVVGSSTIVHTTNGGSTWTIQISDTGYSLSCVDFVDANNGCAVGERVILNTTDGGTSWVPQTTEELLPLFGVDFVDTSNGWAVGGSCLGTECSFQIAHTTDGGGTWTVQLAGYDMYLPLLALDFVDANDGWAVGGHSNRGSVNRVVRRTTDGGQTWTEQNVHGLVPLNSVAFVDDDHGWAVGAGTVGFPNGIQECAILHSTDRGVTWAEFSDTGYTLACVDFVDARHGWTVGSGGKILRYNPSLQAPGEHSNLQPLSFSLSTYPNPFNPSTTIAYDLPKAGHIYLRVFDLLGRQVALLKDGFVDAGNHRMTFDGSGLASGIYFARLDAGKFSQTKKLMLLK